VKFLPQALSTSGTIKGLRFRPLAQSEFHSKAVLQIVLCWVCDIKNMLLQNPVPCTVNIKDINGLQLSSWIEPSIDRSHLLPVFQRYKYSQRTLWLDICTARVSFFTLKALT